MGCAMALLALGVGYLVLLQANKEKESLKLLGQVIAILIMLGAMGSAICGAIKCAKQDCSMGKAQCAVSAKAPMCPLTGKSAEAPQP